MTTTDIHALVGAYALDAVDDLERAAFERHLADCDACRTEADELRETTARLADNTWSVPPPRLRTEVLGAVTRTRQLSPGAPVRRERDTAAVSRWRRFTAGAAAAAVLAAGAGAATWAVQEQRVRDERSVAAGARQQEARIRTILAAPDLVVRTAPMIRGGRVTVSYSAALRSSVVAIHADQPLAPDRALQMWTIRGKGAPVSAGILPGGEQSALRIVDGVPGNDTFAVSEETAGPARATPTDVRAFVPLV